MDKLKVQNLDEIVSSIGLGSLESQRPGGVTAAGCVATAVWQYAPVGDFAYSFLASAFEAKRRSGKKVPIFETRCYDKIITLVGAIHIGYPDYYDNLEKILDAHDSVFIEKVKGHPNDCRHAGLRKFVEGMAVLREAVGRTEGLVSQTIKFPSWLNKGTYKVVDVSFKDIENKLYSHGALCNLWTGIKLYVSGCVMKRLAKNKEFIEKRQLLFSNDPLSEGDKKSRSILKSVLLDYRNDVVFEEIKKWNSEHATGSLAVCYGAAHLPGIENALVNELGFKRVAAYRLMALCP